MRLLLIHTDQFDFAVTGTTSISKSSKELTEADKQGTTGEALVAFLAAEEGDERGIESVANQGAGVILELAEKVGAPDIWVYPYAHLSSRLSNPRVAQKILDKVEEKVRKGAGERGVHRAPFGYYKSFKIACKGHPLSELARTITPKGAGGADEEPQSDAVKKEKELKSEWWVYSPEAGVERVTTEDFHWKANPGLKSFFAYESEGNRQVDEPPPHIRLMRDLELVDYEPGSDAGNLRWYPNGYLIKKLLEDRTNEMMANFGAMQIETPIMYDYGHPHLCKYLNRFPARQYVLSSDKRDFFLRFAACFGGYLMMHDGTLSYRHLPAKYYELTHFSFRREQSGELAGLRRLRAFTMPDMHTLVADTTQAKEEFLAHVRLCREWLDDLDIEPQVAIRFVKSFLDEHPELPDQVTEIMGRPALVEIWDQRFFYFVAKFECNFVDSSGKAACLGTTQIDVENAELFEIHYKNSEGEKINPLIMHTSIPGAIERNLYAILETQAMAMKKGKKANLPFWLAPTQVRFIPVKPEHVARCTKLVEACGFRADMDDRADLTLGKRIRAAEKSWTPYIAVIGDKEIEEETVNLRTRGEKAQQSMTPEALDELLTERQASQPFRPLNVPVCLSKRPIFVG
jgi:threonyl-tRNA synthetase